MDPKERQKLYLLFGIFGIALLVGYYNLLLKPQFAKFLVCNREFGTINTRVRSAESLVANEMRFKKQHETLTKEFRSLEEKFFKQDEISSLLGNFSDIAESSGVRILRIKPLESVPDSSADATASSEFYSEFPILIEAKAGYHQLGDFVDKIEKADRFIRIDDIYVKGTFESPREHEIRFRVITYVLQ